MFLNIHKVLKARGSKPKSYIMVNECSSDLKEGMKNYDIDFQLDPPHMHRLNVAEKAIRNYKNHYIYGFLTTYPYFPIIKWDRLISQ